MFLDFFNFQNRLFNTYCVKKRIFKIPYEMNSLNLAKLVKEFLQFPQLHTLKGKSFKPQ